MSNLECNSSVGLAAKQPIACLVKVHFKLVILIAFEYRIFHYLPYNVLYLTNPEIQILIPISWSLTHVEASDPPILNSFLHPLMQIRVQILGIKFGIAKHSYDFFQLLCSPSTQEQLIIFSLYCINQYILVCTNMYWFKLVNIT